jgi:predicted secreted protein
MHGLIRSMDGQPLAEAAMVLLVKRARLVLAALLFGLPAWVWAQAPTAVRPEGTAVLMTGSAEIELPNDEAHVSFYLELQEADPAKAQSQLNQRVAAGIAALKRADPSAAVETGGYGSYPLYSPGSGRKITGWRARQSVNIRTADLQGLARTVAAGQQHLALGGTDFRVSREARGKAEAQLIERAVRNFNDRVAAAAQALGVQPAKVRIEELNFAMQGGDRPPVFMAMRSRDMAASAESVAEPQLDPGRSLQQLTVSGRARLPLP